MGDKQFNIFTGCPNSLMSAMVISGGSEQFIAKSKCSIHDTMMVVMRLPTSWSVIVIGSTVELKVTLHL